MNSMNKRFTSTYSVIALAAASVVFVACSKYEIEQAAQPMTQPLMAVPIKTASLNDMTLEPEMVTDVNGNATAVWEKYDGTRFNIWTAYRAAGANWGKASLLETDDSGDAYSPQIAVDGIGNVTAVWKQSDGKRFSIYANRYVNGKGWEGATQIESGINSQVSAGAPLVTYDALGYAMVSWQELDGLNTKTWVNHHNGDAGWGKPRPFVASAVDKNYPRFDLNENGDVAVVVHKNEVTTALSENPFKKNGHKEVSLASAVNN